MSVIVLNGMMSKMFSDELVSQYSLSGVKQEKNFSSLSTYFLSIGKSNWIPNRYNIIII